MRSVIFCYNGCDCQDKRAVVFVTAAYQKDVPQQHIPGTSGVLSTCFRKGGYDRLIRAAYDRELNIIAITTADVEGDFSILLNEKMIDFSQPVVISVNGEETTLNIVPDLKTLYETTYMRGDPNYQFEAEVSIRVRR